MENTMTKVAVLGAGQIGRAAYQIITNLRESNRASNNPYRDVEAFVVDSNQDNVFKLSTGSHYILDVNTESNERLVEILVKNKVTHVVNAMPFFLNERIATCAKDAGCAYIDFTEDDEMADKVQEIYKDSGLTCAVKCGLAPGFVNYIGYDLTGQIDTTDSLVVSVGALPRTVSYSASRPEDSYNLTWSVDGLVNEYIRPCRIRKNGVSMKVDALTNLVKVVIDGTEYEAAYTSGGVGSLVRDLTNVKDVAYMTLRYPGHYEYVRDAVKRNRGNFEKIKKEFLQTFPFTNDDVIVLYATAVGKNKDGLVRRSFSGKYYGVDGLSAIQATTAGSGIAVLELMLTNRVEGLINHSGVNLTDFTSTEAFKKYYSTR
jgi:saccharopine dehydrogenase-like NADP-dependent oxidoreductase